MKYKAIIYVCAFALVAGTTYAQSAVDNATGTPATEAAREARNVEADAAREARSVEARAANEARNVEARAAREALRVEARAERREQIESRRAEIEARIEEKRLAITETLYERLMVRINRIADRLAASLDRLDSAAVRIQERTDEIADLGIDTTATETLISAAQEDIVALMDRIEGIATDAEFAITDEADPQAAWAEAREEIMAIIGDLNEVRATLRQSIAALKDAVASADGTRGVSEAVRQDSIEPDDMDDDGDGLADAEEDTDDTATSSDTATTTD